MLILSDCLIIIGFKAAGKSTLGKALAKFLAVPCYDLDDLLLKKLGYPDIKTCFSKLGEAEFRRQELATVKELCAFDQAMIIATGGGVVFNDCLMSCLQKKGKILFLNTHYPLIENRLFQDKEEILYLNQVFNRTTLKTLYEIRLPKYKAYADLIIGEN